VQENLIPTPVACSVSNNKTRMKILFALALLVLINTAFQCEPRIIIPEESKYCSNVDWLRSIIENAQQSNSKTEVIRYQYKGETVYYIDTCLGCADSMRQVYNCPGEVICQFGGIAGFNTCPDFESTATNKKVIWKNS
jgi:hypothetical protein